MGRQGTTKGASVIESVWTSDIGNVQAEAEYEWPGCDGGWLRITEGPDTGDAGQLGLATGSQIVSQVKIYTEKRMRRVGVIEWE
jgi:hypothetical protein